MPVAGSEGWKVQRISASHHIYAKPGEPKVLSIPVHAHRNLKPGLAARVARDAKIEW